MKSSKLFILSLCTALVALSACNQTITDKADDTAKTDVQNVTSAPGAITHVDMAEFWADDLKPEGYNDSIGSVLALMMDANKQDQTREYDVLVVLREASLEDARKVCDTSTWRAWDPTGTLLAGTDCYITKLTAETINKLAEKEFNDRKASFYYIGSGETDNSHEYRSAEWIVSACEHTGDQVVFGANGDLVYSPDITIEDDITSIEDLGIEIEYDDKQD